MPKLSSEFRLAAACCAWPPSPERDSAVRALAAGADWAAFLTVARRQRVEGLVSHALRRAEVSLPASIQSELALTAAAIARGNLAYAAESRHIHQAFVAAGLSHLFVKGATLDMLAYRSLGLKRARDIDMVVDPESVERACALLSELGYVRTVPGPEIDEARFPIWVKLCKETNWQHRRSGTVVELHSQLVDNADLLPGIGARSPSQIVEIGTGMTLPTLRNEELFAYLCVHGATHAWSRLKWIADVAAFLARFEPAEVERLYRASLDLGVGRCSAQALLLCRQLFDTPVSLPLLRELQGERATRMVVRLALGVMAGGRSAELDDTVLGTVPIHLSHFFLGRGLRYKGGELGRKLRNHDDQVRFDLPPFLHFLYPLISVPSWLYRRVRGPGVAVGSRP